MWVAQNWKDYKVLDCSEGEKLETWGGYKLLRPDPQVIWSTSKDKKLWGNLNAHYHRSSKGGGEWEFFNLPEQWTIAYRDLTFNLKPFSFKHTGLFPEQAVNWDWMREIIAKKLADDTERKINILNLFAYTGGATIACAKEGANEAVANSRPVSESRVSVTHVDASKGMVGWAKENAQLSGLGEAPIRYLVDDCKKFVEKEIRRGRRYDAIIMDPPSYGRGPGGEIWKLEESLYPFVELCEQILSDDPMFVLINSYTTGLQPAVLSYMLSTVVAQKHSGYVAADEIGLPVECNGLVLPCGASGRFFCN